MLKAVLFDIDNTLILFDEVKFFKTYVPGVASKFSDIMSFEEFHQRLIGGSQKLLTNMGQKTNAEFYMDAFCEGLEAHRDSMWERFVNFYQSRFNQYQELTEPVTGVRELFDYLSGTSLKLVAASHPLWPMMVQGYRIGWAGLPIETFDHITAIENTKFCKPQAQYYQEICENLSVLPSECLMVGNDLINDMVATKAGMRTYQTTDAEEKGFLSFAMSKAIRNGHQEEVPEPDFKGPLAGVREVVEGLV